MSWFKKRVPQKESSPRGPEFKIKFTIYAKNDEDLNTMAELWKVLDKSMPNLCVGDSSSVSLSFFDNISDENLLMVESNLERTKILQTMALKIEAENLDKFVRIKRIADELERILMLSKLNGDLNG